MQKPLIVVTGKNGQLGWELQQLAPALAADYDWLFVDADSLDLSKPDTIEAFFAPIQPAYFIHCAAYTAVDKAETEQALAYNINAVSVGEIANQCAQKNCVLITISTDYVFDGNGTAPYKTNHPIQPVNYYGYTKKVSEELALANNPQTIIIRTSWVYSTHGHNFVKTMLRLMNERTELKVIADQLGCPTYAADLASAIVQVVQQTAQGNTHFGTYHYSNSGIISWHDFATAIQQIANLSCQVLPITTAEYPTPAKRPAYSAMDTSDIATNFGVSLIPWRNSLEKCIHLLQS